MSPLDAAAVVAAGMGAGAVNAVIGSGSLITFPTLLAVGLPPVTANVTNNIGLVPGSVAGALGFRRELVGQGRRARILAAGSGSGGFVGAVLLLALPSDVFDTLVPLLVLTACVLMTVQPWLSRWVAERRSTELQAHEVGPLPVFIAFVAGIYGGYFGAAQGVILIAMLAVLVPDDLTRTNALKNVLAGTVNAVAAVVFILFAEPDWTAVALVAAGAIIGGTLGASVGRRIPPTVLRVMVILLGLGVSAKLFLT